MGLKIDRICDATMTLSGTLDGTLPVSGDIKDGKIRIRIAGWIHEISDDVLQGAAALRYAVYSSIAQYRNEQNAAAFV